MPIATITVPAGNYTTNIDGVAGSITVPTLVPGSIVQTAPVLGDTLTVTGSNASADAQFQWQRDGVDIVGATAAIYDTTGQASGVYRRCVTDGLQGPVYSETVLVNASGSGPTVLVTDSFDAADGYALDDDFPGTSTTWVQLQVVDPGDILARVSPLGTVQFNSIDGAENLRVAYAGPVGDNQAIETVFGGFTRANRADPVLFVRGAGTNLDDTGVRAFFRTLSNELILTEFSAGASLQQEIISIPSLSSGDVLRVEVNGTTAVALLNSLPVLSLTGLSITGGAPGFGAFLGNTSDVVSFNSMQVESL